jgi:hypothetical protein
MEVPFDQPSQDCSSQSDVSHHCARDPWRVACTLVFLSAQRQTKRAPRRDARLTLGGFAGLLRVRGHPDRGRLDMAEWGLDALGQDQVIALRAVVRGLSAHAVRRRLRRFRLGYVTLSGAGVAER